MTLVCSPLLALHIYLLYLNNLYRQIFRKYTQNMLHETAQLIQYLNGIYDPNTMAMVDFLPPLVSNPENLPVSIPSLIDQINNQKTDTVLINYTYDRRCPESLYDLLADQTNKKLIILTSNYKFFRKKHKAIVYLNYYFFDLIQSWKRYEIEQLRPKLMSCLNKNLWTHRIINFLNLEKQPWYNQCLVSFGWNVNDSISLGLDESIIELQSIITDEEISRLKQLQLPIMFEDIIQARSVYYNGKSIAHQDCYIDYVLENGNFLSTESSCKQHMLHMYFITEKIWKPLLSGQFFFLFGPQGLIDHLEDLGIDTYKDIIDHSYDHWDSIDIRMHSLRIIDSIDKLIKQGIEHAWVDTTERRKKNIEYLYSEEFKNILLLDLKEKLIEFS